MTSASSQATVDSPKSDQVKLPCSKCAGNTVHVVQKSLNVSGDVEGWLFWCESYQLIQCRGSEEYSFRILRTNSDDYYIDDEGTSVLNETSELYPPRIAGRPPLRNTTGIPPMLRAIYEETHKALLNQQHILAGVGIRSLVEAVCREKGAKGRDLAKRIDGLVDLGIMTKDGAEILHTLRDLGNAAVHEAKIHSEKELSTAFDVVEHLLNGVYVLPRRAKALRKKTK